MRRFFHSLICNDSFKCSLGELLLSYIVLSFYFTINWILVIVNIFMMVVNYKYKTIPLLPIISVNHVIADSKLSLSRIPLLTLFLACL